MLKTNESAADRKKRSLTIGSRNVGFLFASSKLVFRVFRSKALRFASAIGYIFVCHWVNVFLNRSMGLSK